MLASENNTINAIPSIQRENVSFLSSIVPITSCPLLSSSSRLALHFAEIKSSDFTTLILPSTSNSPESYFIIAFLSCNLLIVLPSTHHCRVFIDMDMAKRTQNQLHSHCAICVNAIATVALISACAVIRYATFVVVVVVCRLFIVFTSTHHKPDSTPRGVCLLNMNYVAQQHSSSLYDNLSTIIFN